MNRWRSRAYDVGVAGVGHEGGEGGGRGDAREDEKVEDGEEETTDAVGGEEV